MVGGDDISRSEVGRIRVITIIALIFSWELLSRSGLFFEGVFPTSLAIIEAMISEVLDPSFHYDLGITMFEATIGFFLGSVFAFIIAAWIGLNPYARRMVEPYIIALGGTPKIIFLPILFLIFGLGVESKIAKGAMSAFFPVVLSCTSGFVQIPKVLLRVGQSFDMSRWQMAWKIYMPAISNPLLTGLRLGMAMAIIGVLAAEIAYANAGLGHRLIRFADRFDMPAVYAVTILIFTVSWLTNVLISKVQTRFNKHNRGQRPSSLGIGSSSGIA